MFNSTSKEFSFIVNGTSGTMGYLDVYLFKSFFSDISAINILLDDKKVPFNVQSQEDSWLVSLAYNHSSHRVAIQSNSVLTTTVDNLFGYWIIAAMIIPIVVAITVVLLIYRRKKKG